MLFNKIQKTKNRFRAYHTHQAVQTTGSTANYFICKVTTAISEGINNKIKRLKRMAYGYKDVKYFLLKIHQHCGLLNPRLQLKHE